MPCLSSGAPPGGNPEQPVAGMVRIQNPFAVKSFPQVKLENISLGNASTTTWYRWPLMIYQVSRLKKLRHHLPIPTNTLLVVYGCIGTKSLLMTVMLWLSIAKTNVVSTEVLIKRRRYFLPWKLGLDKSKKQGKGPYFLKGCIIFMTTVPAACIAA